MKYFKKSILFSSVMMIAACNNSESQDENTLPVVSAGENQRVDERSNVGLSGTAQDAEGEVTAIWTQVSGTSVDIEEADTLTPQFRTPSTRQNETLVFRLTVTDEAGESVSDDVEVLVTDRTASSQGINDNAGERRNRANANRDDDGDGPTVDNREVRTFDGSNNNIENPLWGTSFSHLQRWADVAYEDGISSMAGASRPSARLVSNNVANQDVGVVIPNTFNTTDYLWQWGQFIDHDIGVTDGAEETADIIVPKGDIYFDPNNTGNATILFSRALFDHETGTSISNPREQENELTVWLDGSMIYGSDDIRAAALRVSENSPYLATSDGNLLPFNTSGQTNANAFGVPAEALFLGGDIRANEQLGLTTMHTLWVREHNRIAAILEEESPNSTGEEIFQAARRLVIAKIQIITYEEYLPALLGENAIPEYEGYDATVHPGLYNEFSVAAYRYGHSLLNEFITRLDVDLNEIDEGHVPLRGAFFTGPQILTEEDSLDPILRGFAHQLSQKLDTKVVADIRNFLFGEPGAGGLDLVSLNIQRGRDHGIPSYNDMREVFGLERKTSFSEITSDTALQQALETTYGDVDEIDLWVGGLAEDALSEVGSQMGELFRLMNIVQFSAFRDGDRFWYENDLTEDELERVEGATLADVIRANTNIGDEIQDNVFEFPSS
ncbi:peroxidase family protein [Paraglaciecola sp. 2405UD69-4]|uniref:peroxidase family protein n=1 Tax=Paraglaciecola sp. 2405UD69-4 TaxID=3391836 RepID=UPI0039C9D3C7